MRFLIVGCGSIGQRHLGNLVSLGEKDVVALDLNSERRSEVSKKFNVPTVSSLEEALKKGIGAALICTPTQFHLADALPLARTGAHLFVEKPIGASLDGVDDLIAAAKSKGKALFVGCNFRFERGLARVKQLLEQGAIGRPLGARVCFGQYLPDWHPKEDYRKGYSAQKKWGGGIILDAVHEIDYIRWLLGEVRSVACFAGKVSDLDVDVEDTADILFRFENGINAQVHLDYLQRSYQRSLEIYGSEGTVTWSFQDREVRLFSAKTKTWETFSFRQGPGEDVNDMYVSEMKHFLDCVHGRAVPSLDGFGGKRVLQIALAAKTSAAEKKVIDLS